MAEHLFITVTAKRIQVLASGKESGVAREHFTAPEETIQNCVTFLYLW